MRRGNGFFAVVMSLVFCSCGGAAKSSGPSGPDAAPEASVEAGVDAQAEADASAQPEGTAAQSDSGSVDVSAANDGPSALSGVYSGYIESFMFPDGSDTLVFTLTFNDDGTVTGTVRFGTAPLLGPPTDASVGYPPGYGEMYMGAFGPQAPLEGFSFTVLSGTYMMSPRLQLQVDPRELWKQWCELQTTIYPYYNGAQTGCGPLLGYACMPNGVTGGATGGGNGCQDTPCNQTQPIPVDCGKLTLCAFGPGPCTCTSTSCTVVVGPMGSIAFDTQLVAGGINGSVTGLDNGQILSVHLTKMQ
jgi:hypothetical protein